MVKDLMEKISKVDEDESMETGDKVVSRSCSDTVYPYSSDINFFSSVEPHSKRFQSPTAS